MKKSDLMNLIKSDEGTLRVNPICTLRRWTVDPLYDKKVDRLVLDFSAIDGLGRFCGSAEIESREYDGIVCEIEKAIYEKMKQATDYLISALKNGYTF